MLLKVLREWSWSTKGLAWGSSGLNWVSSLSYAFSRGTSDDSFKKVILWSYVVECIIILISRVVIILKEMYKPIILLKKKIISFFYPNP